MTKQKKSINLDNLKVVREVAVKLGEEIEFTEKVKEGLMLKLLNVQHNCEHDIVVRYNNIQIGREVRCLCCDKAFYGSIVGADFYFKNIIDLQALETEEDKVYLALQLFEQEKKLNPELSDSEIVKIINGKVKENDVFTEEHRFVKSRGTKI